MDISAFFDWFLNTMLELVNMCFQFWDSFKIHGVSLLDISLAILYMLVLLPFLLNISRGLTVSISREARVNTNKKEEKSSSDEEK